MKKMTNVEVNVINLNANDVIATSMGTANNVQGYAIEGGFVGGRGYYEEEEEEIW